MHIALVRHGITADGLKNLHQSSESRLSEDGINQAQVAGSLLTNKGFKIIITSLMCRAIETGEIINTFLNIPEERSDLLNEWKRPTEVIGTERTDKYALKIKQELRDHYVDSSWHFNDEENFYDVLRRVDELLAYLSTKKCNVIIVSHARILSLLEWRLQHKDEHIDPNDYIANAITNVLDYGEVKIITL